MTLRLILGRAGSGKSYTCIDEIKKRNKENSKSKLILLIPEQFSFRAEKMLIENIGCTGINNVFALSFKRLAYTIFNEVGGITHNNLTPTGKAIIINKILNEERENLKVFSLSARKNGFVDTVVSMIDEFKNYNIAPDEISLLKDSLSENPLLCDKISDTARIYGRYNSYLEKGYFDPVDDLSYLKSKIKESSFLENAEIWIDEFYGFTPQQYGIIEELLKKCPRVNVTLPYGGKNSVISESNDLAESDAFYPVFYTENQLLKIISENNIGYDKPVILKGNDKNSNNYRFKNNDELGYLEKNYFNVLAKKYDNEVNNIKVFKAMNTYSEIKYIAKEILKLCREKDYRFKEVAVIARNLESYEDIIKVVFSEYNIPYFLDEKKDINTNPIVILIKSVLEILSNNFSYETVFRYLKSGLLGIDKEEIDLLENYVLQYGIKGKKKYLDDECWSDERLRDCKNKFLLPILNLKSKIKPKNKIDDICKFIFEYLEEINLKQTIEHEIKKLEEENNLNVASEYSSIWNLILGLLDELVEILGEELLSLDDFVEIFNMAISTHEIGLIPPTLDSVTIGSIERIRTEELRAVYVIGVNDGIFPMATIEEGVFSDLDKAILKENGIALSKDTKALMFEEQFLIYAALTLPSETLYISYPIADFEGKSMRPSMIISRIKSLFNINEKSEIVESLKQKDIDDIVAKVPAFNDMIIEIRKYLDSEKISEEWKEVYRYFKDDLEYQLIIDGIFEGFSYKNIASSISKEKAEKLYGDGNYFSVSKIENYVRCPFGYFVQYGLKAKERKLYSFTAPDLGSFMHSVLDKFSKQIEKEGIKWSDLNYEECKNRVENIVNVIMSEDKNFILNSSYRYRYISERLKRVLIRVVSVIAKQITLGCFEPSGYEISFGLNDSDYPPIEIEISDGRIIKLIGRIDRIDKLVDGNQAYYRIIDYKSGIKSFKLSDVYYGLQVQLLTYLDAILNNQEARNEHAKAAGVLYFKLDDPIIKIDENESEEKIREQILKELKMNGLLLKDVEILKDMDKTLDETGKSLIIPAAIKKDGEISSTSSVISSEGFNTLRKHVRNEISKNFEKMLSGNIEISPCKTDSEIPCEYCKLSSICQFSLEFEENKYRVIGGKDDKEILKILEED